MRIPTHPRRLLAAAALACSIAFAAACGSSEPETPAELPRVEAPAFRHQALYASLQGDAEAYALRDGDWVQDYGDAPFYGLAFYTWEGRAQGKQAWLDRADAARARALRVIDKVNLLEDDVNEVAMAALGLIDYIAATGDQGPRAKLDEVIAQLDTATKTFGYYLDVNLGWAFKTYGPTSISGLVGLLNLQYAVLLGGEHRQARLDFALALLAKTDTAAFNGSYYRFSPDRGDKLYLYPNVTMILFHARLYQLTGDEQYRTRALGLYEAIQPHRIEMADGKLRYRSPYSAEDMGAKTDDYSTLSAQNYLMFALMLLFDITNDTKFILEMDRVVDALQADLYQPWCFSERHKRDVCAPACAAPTDVCVVDACEAEKCAHGVLHHWMDGGIAVPDDPEYFCSGCNLQLLYLLWYRQTQLD